MTYQKPLFLLQMYIYLIFLWEIGTTNKEKVLSDLFYMLYVEFIPCIFIYFIDKVKHCLIDHTLSYIKVTYHHKQLIYPYVPSKAKV